MTNSLATFEPTPLQEWLDVNMPRVGDEMIWKSAFGSQVMFLRDTLNALIGTGLSYGKRKKIAKVISTHGSKSIVLPVVEYTRADLGLRFVVRDNFHNFKLSVISETWPITANLDGLCHTTPPLDPDYTGDDLAPVYFEGFPPDRIFGYYESRAKELVAPPVPRDGAAPQYRLNRPQTFSAQFDSAHSLWTAVFLILRSVDAVKPHRWHTPETHKQELADERCEENEDDEAERAEQLAGEGQTT